MLGGAPRPSPHRPPSEGEEVIVEVDDPRLTGRIDQVRDKCLIDTKTGEEEEVHVAQIQFYALLWWLKYEVVPRGLRLLYANRAKPVEVEVPSAAELTQRAEEMRAELRGIAETMRTALAPAKPDHERCRFCPVRQLCDDYWQVSETLPLRTPSDGTAGFLDLRVTGLPAEWRSGQPMVGNARGELAGKATQVHLSIDRSRCPQTGGRPSAALILGARAELVEGVWQVKAISSSEVFWVVPTAQ
jgi:hypothetical protein